MTKKKQDIKYKVGDILSFEQVFDAELEILSKDEFNKRKNAVESSHKDFLNMEEWRKHILWKVAQAETIAVKIEDGKYEIKQIQYYTNKIEDIIHCQENLDALFKYHPMLNSFKYDEYSKTKEFNSIKYDEDMMPSLIFNFFRRNFAEWCPDKQIKDTINETLNNNTYNFLQQYFDGLIWDGVPRLDTFLIEHYNAEDCPLVRAYFSRWMIAGVKRTYEPGAKFDSMLILASSAHGKKKTSLFEWLGSINGRKLYNDAPDDLRNLNDLVYASKGKLILLFDDFDDICDKGQLGKVKSFITQRARTAALKWQHDKDYPITYILGGTTNNIAILVDDATFDERRFQIIEVNPVNDIFDIDESIKEQLYAEAVYRYKSDKNQRLWIWEPELRQAEIEWQKKYKKANEDTQVEKIVNIFNRRYSIKDGIFEDEEQFLKLIELNEEEDDFLNSYDHKHLEYIKIIPAAWITKYLGTSARGTDRIVQILHTQGFKVQKEQRRYIYGKYLTVIHITSQPQR